MKAVKSVFVFCEGPHDVGFIYNVLKTINGFKDIGARNIADLPYPLQQHYISKNLKYEPLTTNQTISDPFMPKSVLWDSKNQTYYILYTAGGVTNLIDWKEDSLVPREIEDINFAVESGLETLNKINEGLEGVSIEFSYKNRQISPKETIQYEPVIAFVMDADEKTDEQRFTEFKTNYTNRFGANSFDATKPNSWNTKKNLGLFIFKGLRDNTGSLEDLVVDVVKDSTTYNNFFNHFNPRIVVKSPGEAKQVSAASIKRMKASMCATGQEFYPGLSLAVTLIDNDDKFLDYDKIKNSSQCKELAAFFQEVVLP